MPSKDAVADQPHLSAEPIPISTYSRPKVWGNVDLSSLANFGTLLRKEVLGAVRASDKSHELIISSDGFEKLAREPPCPGAWGFGTYWTGHYYVIDAAAPSTRAKIREISPHRPKRNPSFESVHFSKEMRRRKTDCFQLDPSATCAINETTKNGNGKVLVVNIMPDQTMGIRTIDLLFRAGVHKFSAWVALVP